MPKVLTETRDRAFVVTINRPDVRNCVDGETAALLFEAVETFRVDDSLDALILTGAGPSTSSGQASAFCAGADLKGSASLMTRPGAQESGPMGFSRITDLEKPTIAAVNGYCLAGGLELACWCDFRIADETSHFGVLNRRWGVSLVDGGTQRLPRIVGMGNALYLIESGVMINAQQALRMGLVQEVVPKGGALERALALAKAISSYPQLSLRNDRCAAIEGFSLTLPEGLELERRVHEASLADPAMVEGLRRYAAGDRPAPPRPPG
ncbi:MAG: enoyl-CoA hydratase/isomerase family protein [Chloroflexi bacterium]|nr:enoyl-CoA hydratase/isomerase family protein [Chloroflexota bacterium]